MRRTVTWLLVLGTLGLLLVGGISSWQWLDRNVLHWGLDDAGEQTVSAGQLLRQVRAFEVTALKNTYAGTAHIEVSKRLRAGPVRVGLPGWVAGEQLDVTGTVTVAAGVDLSGVGPADMTITQAGKDTVVTVHLPAARVLSTELQPNTLKMSTGEGLITRVGQRIGMTDTDLRNRSADEVLRTARDTAIEQGLLDQAGRETAHRLQTFLQSLPQPAGSKVTYVVKVREPALQ
jgi:hypothetical protein